MTNTKSIQTERLELPSYGEIEIVDLVVSRYATYNNTAIALTCSDSREPYGALTVNIQPLKNGIAAVDTNNSPDAEEFIKKYNLGKPLGTTLQSGFCEYPLYNFSELVAQVGEV